MDESYISNEFSDINMSLSPKFEIANSDKETWSPMSFNQLKITSPSTHNEILSFKLHKGIIASLNTQYNRDKAQQAPLLNSKLYSQENSPLCDGKDSANIINDLDSSTNQIVSHLFDLIRTVKIGPWNDENSQLLFQSDGSKEPYKTLANINDLYSFQLQPYKANQHTYEHGILPILIKLHQMFNYLIKYPNSEEEISTFKRSSGFLKNSNCNETMNLWDSIKDQVIGLKNDPTVDNRTIHDNQIDIIINLKPQSWFYDSYMMEIESLDEVIVDQETRELTINLEPDVVAFACECYGRYDLYLISLILYALNTYKSTPLIQLGIKLPLYFSNSWQMVAKRARHALRVYKEASEVCVVTQNRLEWYLTLFADGSLGAIQDTLKDLDNEVWYSQFNKNDLIAKKRLEQLLIMLLGYEDLYVRDKAIVLLNSFYDNHSWQGEMPFDPIIKSVGQQFHIEVLIYENTHHAWYIDEPRDIFIQLSAPCFDLNSHAYIFSTHIFSWKKLEISSTSNNGTSSKRVYWRGTLNFGEFPRCGFYDWRVVRSDVETGSWIPLTFSQDCILLPQSKLSQKNGENWIQEQFSDCYFGRPFQGRFIVHPRNIGDEQIHEIFIDQHDARWNEDTGELTHRGSFATIKESLEKLKNDGVTMVYLMGAAARDNGQILYTSHGDLIYERPDAPPFALTCRASPNEMLGGPEDFKELMHQAKRVNIKVIIDSLTRVSSSRPHRKYWPLLLNTLDETGKKVILYGTDGRSVSFEDSALLNYRNVKAWDLLISDIEYWALKMEVDGVRLDNAQLWPLILPSDKTELGRVDSDGQNHYTREERLFGTVVLQRRGEATGFWNSNSALKYPNPMFIKLAKELWKKRCEFAIIGECWEGDNFDTRSSVLARSGVIPQLQQLPYILCKVYGKEIDSNAHVINLPEPMPIHILKEWYERSHQDMPEGAFIVQSSCSHSSPLPGLLYGRGAWQALDLLLFLPDIPSTFAGEMEGMAYRLDVTNVYQTHEISRHSKAIGLSGYFGSGTHSAISSTRSLVNLSDKDKSPENERDKQINLKESPRALLSHVRSLNKFEHITKLNDLEEEHVKELGPDVGFNIKQIKGHYLHRRMLRHHFKLLRSGTFHPLTALRPNNSVHPFVFAFARCDPFTGFFVVVALNFENNVCDEITISLKSLKNIVLKSYNNSERYFIYKSFDILQTQMDGTSTSETCYQEVDELFSQPLNMSLKGYGVACLGFELLEYSNFQEDIEKLLFESSIKRLEKIVRKIKLQRLHTLKANPVLIEVLKKNFVFSSLLKCLEPDCSLELFRLYLAKIVDILSLQENYANQNSNLTLLNICFDSNIFSDNEDLANQLIAKLRTTSEAYPEASKEVIVAQQFLENNDLGFIVFVTPELGKWSSVGGLGVMVNDLSTTLAQTFEQEIWVISPFYERNLRGETHYLERDGIFHEFNIEIQIGYERFILGVHTGKIKGVNLIFLHNSQLFPYPYPNFLGPDVVRMLVAIGKGSLEALCQMRRIPQLIVTNDWSTALTPAYAKQGFFGDIFENTTFFHIVHNLDSSYEGRIYTNKRDDMSWIHNLSGDLLVDPYWQQFVINPSRCALLQCDAWGTVSVSYRDDLRGVTGQNPSPLAPLLNQYQTPFAHPNGIPIEDREARIKAYNFKDHWEAKGAIQKNYFKFTYPDLSIPLFVFIGRITAQKGVHILLDAVENIIRHYDGRIQILIGGKANWNDAYSQRCAHRMSELSRLYPWSVWASPDEFFNDGPIANYGADFGLMPSAFEPGGIVQHEFFVAGTPVLAFHTGGLKDTITEFNLETHEGNGFVFESYTSGDFLFAMERAIRVFKDTRKYNLLRQNARKSVISCENVAKAWLKEFYRIRRRIFYNPSKVRGLANFYLENLKTQNQDKTSKDIIMNEEYEEINNHAKNLNQYNTTVNNFEIESNGRSSSPQSKEITNLSELQSPTSKCSTNEELTQNGIGDNKFVYSNHFDTVDAINRTESIKNSSSVALMPVRIKYSPPPGKARPRSVAITGSFDDWSVRRPLTWDNALQAFTTTISPKAGKYFYKFIVDGDWLCSPDVLTEKDADGNLNNIMFAF